MACSAFEFFLLTAEEGLLLMFFRSWPPDDILRLLAVSRRVYCAVDFYRRRAWDSDSFFADWFPEDVLPELCDKLEEWNAVVTGSAVHQYFGRHPRIPGSDLDVLVPLESLLPFGRWLKHCGYHFRPRPYRQSVYFDISALSLPGRIMCSGANAALLYDPLSFASPFEVFDFHRTEDGATGGNSLHIQLIAVVGDPLRHVLAFHSSMSIPFLLVSARIADGTSSCCDECLDRPFRGVVLSPVYIYPSYQLGMSGVRTWRPRNV